MEQLKNIAIVGGGPGGLFMFKRLIESGRHDISIDVYEKKNKPGAGMPYSSEGANDEHITNVSGNEIPELVIPIEDWIQKVHADTLSRFNIDLDTFHEYKVLPRLLFGDYLCEQFNLLRKQSKEKGIQTSVFFNAEVTDLSDNADVKKVRVHLSDGTTKAYDHIIVCTGHLWPKDCEETENGCYDSPYPPAKLSLKVDFPIALKGASLTAIDAIKTLSQHNGRFSRNKAGQLVYTPDEDSKNFKIVMHSRSGLLPAVRFHSDDLLSSQYTRLSWEDIQRNREQNDGFLSLDYVFEKRFKDLMCEKHREFYDQIRDMQMEDFVSEMMARRLDIDPVQLFKAEYAEAEKSIRRKQSVYWKESLAVLSYAMNYPAKYFSAEDMQRLQKVLMPLISIVIACVPQRSAEEMIALFQAGVLEIIAVGDDSRVEVKPEGGVIYHYTDESGRRLEQAYDLFVDCTGQPHLAFKDFPFQALKEQRAVSPARVQFRNPENGIKALEEDSGLVEKDTEGRYFLRVPGIAINDSFQVVDAYNAYNERIYVMAVPFIGGYNPDYSGLDFCATASEVIMKSLNSLRC
ncbi:FAD/NAD(P)-binding protein [Pedobacter deserti]|uniref:FAD/NAD(P)-binding protein n=1 Tax=Pedobacter deserti TaxID=2817382 RepID=UPI00210A9C67|nr:FAD/NAD(P)-binding protein [Pedobacter sp. SYSU D00382]